MIFFRLTIYVGCFLVSCDSYEKFPLMIRCSIRLSLQLFVGGFMSYLLYLFLFAYCGVQPAKCCVFVLFVFIFVPYVARFLFCLHMVVSNTYCVVFLFCFLRLVCPVLSLSWLSSSPFISPIL